MTTVLGFALLPLWIMGVPVIGALISLAMPAPRLNTMPRQRRLDGHLDAPIAAHRDPVASPYPRA